MDNESSDNETSILRANGSPASHRKYTKRSNESQPLLTSFSENETGHDFLHLSCNTFPDEPEYSELIERAEIAIDHNILPQRIYQGSSGSYFVKDISLVIIEKQLWFIENKRGNYLRKRSAYSNQKTKNHTACWIQSGQNGCTKSAAHVVSVEVVWYLIRAIWARQRPVLSIKSWIWELCRRHEFVFRLVFWVDSNRLVYFSRLF